MRNSKGPTPPRLRGRRGIRAFFDRAIPSSAEEGTREFSRILESDEEWAVTRLQVSPCAKGPSGLHTKHHPRPADSKQQVGEPCRNQRGQPVYFTQLVEQFK